MKRGPNRAPAAYPKGIVEIPAARIDPRADPGATQKITREQLDEALKRTKSGTRPAMRSEAGASYDEESFGGPRDDDDAPQITIVKIDSVEIESIDPSSLPPAAPQPLLPARSSGMHALASTTYVPTPLEPSAHRRVSGTTLAQRFRATPRFAFIAGIAVATLVVLAVLAGFFAGRLTQH